LCCNIPNSPIAEKILHHEDHEVLKRSCLLLFFVRFVVFVVKSGLRLAELCLCALWQKHLAPVRRPLPLEAMGEDAAQSRKSLISMIVPGYFRSISLKVLAVWSHPVALSPDPTIARLWLSGKRGCALSVPF
jgi:hypothetical protein